jgi:hypothetical protein
MFTAISFEMTTPMFIDNTLETNVEVSLEEKGSETKLDEKLIPSNFVFSLKNTKVFKGFDFLVSPLNQLYLNNIFKPPKLS